MRALSTATPTTDSNRLLSSDSRGLELTKYADGQDVKLGDRVSLGQDNQGVVVALMDTAEFDARHPKDQWAYLKTGMIVEFPSFGLIHYESPEPDLRLIERKR